MVTATSIKATTDSSFHSRQVFSHVVLILSDSHPVAPPAQANYIAGQARQMQESQSIITTPLLMGSSSKRSLAQQQHQEREHTLL